MKSFVLLTTVLLLATAATGLAQKAQNKQPSDVLTAWMGLHTKMVRRTSGIAHVAYARQFCYTAIAAYESIVKSNSAYRSLAGQLTGLPALPESPVKTVWPVSLNAAYAAMLRTFFASFPACLTTIDSMEKEQEHLFAKAPVTPRQLAQSAAYGRAVAAAITQWAETDGTNTQKVYTSLQAEGVWSPATSAAEPFWYERRSLTKNLFSAFTLIPPAYAADSAGSFYQNALEVYTTSMNLTPEQKATALYWDDSPGEKYISVFGHWTSILSGLIKQHQLSLIEGATPKAKMGITLHEATLLAWKGKYQYNVVRPVTFIRQYINKQWSPLIATPPHPEFPAAHATFSNAAATALCTLFGETCQLTDKTYTDIGMNERTYSTLQDAAHEAGYSRLYGGIHYRYSIEQGFLLGEAAARHVDKSVQFKAKTPGAAFSTPN